MMYRLVAVLALGLLGVFIWFKIKNSKWFDDMFKNATTEKSFERAETTQVINNIANAETALSDRADDNKKQAEKLGNESKVIQDFLKSRDGSQGDSDNEKEDTPME
jgi:hypothetical protein